MFKTGLKIFIAIAALAALVLGYYYFFQQNRNVPDAYGILIKKGPVLRVNKPEKFWSALDRNGFLDNNDTSWMEVLGNFQFISEHESVKNIYVIPRATNNKLSLAFIIENYSTSHAYNAIEYLKDSVFKKLKVISKEKDGFDYFAVYQSENPFAFFANIDGIVCVTISDSVLFQLESDISNADNIEKGKLFGTANNKVIASLFFDRSVQKDSSNKYLFNLLQKPYGYADKFVLDIYLRDGVLMMSGLSIPASGSMQEELTRSNSRPFELAEIIPENISMLYQLSADGLVTHFNRKDLINEKENLWLSSFTVDEYSFFKTDNYSGLGIKAKGKTSAFEALKSYEKIIGESVSYHPYRFDKEISFDIAKGNFSWIEGLLPGFYNSKDALKYAVAAGNYIIFTNNYREIKTLCKNTVLNRNLQSSYRFEKHKDDLSSESNTLFYSLFNAEQFKELISPEMNNLFLDYGFYNNFETVAAQTSGSGEHLYNQIVFFGKSGRLQKSNVNWKTKMSASASLKPVVVKNHINNDDEIFVQDQNNYIYLISKKGRVLWQKMVDGQIISDVYQVDKYKNRKLQYLFNTRGKVYLIDRNGNDVERFPMSLPVKASAGLSVFDYEKNKNYRMFLPLKDKRVRLYDLDANLISGWHFNKSDAPVTTPVQHYRFGGKDYLVFGDSLRMYILNRRGQSRIKPEKLVGKSAKNSFYFDAKKARWVCTTTRGKVFSVNIAGEVNIIHEKTLSGNHYFMMADLSRNGQQDYIFINNNKLTVLDHNFKETIAYNFPNTILEPPAYYLFSRHKAGIGIVDKVDGKVYMFDRQAKQFAGFPYPGVTPFTISVIRGYVGFQLIVGNFDGFLYEYQLK